jgi:hypothetical protein
MHSSLSFPPLELPNYSLQLHSALEVSLPPSFGHIHYGLYNLNISIRSRYPRHHVGRLRVFVQPSRAHRQLPYPTCRWYSTYNNLSYTGLGLSVDELQVES